MGKNKHVARTGRIRSPQKVIAVELDRKRYLKRCIRDGRNRL
jgi:hypothetical protein